ncbi:S1C family serine protease [Leptolyngbya sp. 7M]|uniref:S1C family serine protease n=1 Tax=Leptolyngbya sp. 7M TaxID=2812896 RepID=UPI001B8C239D|nr:PDZ domain-containing protein [Leptolyngbya sp. 7M]QYO67554.1 PDZ domain-containing protein [Leptolyngbya sp. 7M]
MMAKALAFVLSISVFGIAAIAQTPEPRQRIEPRVFSWTFGSTGGYLGIEMAEISNENLGKFGLSAVRGVGVEKVSADSPAERAGILAGDVIVRVNGEEVTSTQKLSRMIGEIAPDHTARITVLRGGSERELSVTIGKRPAPKFDEAGAFGRLEDLWKNEGRPEAAPPSSSAQCAAGVG